MSSQLYAGSEVPNNYTRGKTKDSGKKTGGEFPDAPLPWSWIQPQGKQREPMASNYM